MSDLPGYSAARESVAYYLIPEPGYILIDGPDQIDFLQRQTTNDVRLLKPGYVVPTVLTSPTARILDVLYLLLEEEANGGIGAITLPGKGQHTTSYFHSHIFFMDKVSVKDASSQFIQLDLEGPHSPALIEQLGSVAPAKHQVITANIAGQPVRLHSKRGIQGTGFRLLLQTASKKAVVEALEASGASQIGQQAYQALRVEAGLPGEGHELSEEYNPLEIGLEEAISSDKGCYTGQEIIARQITYDKVTRRLVGLLLDAPVEAGKPLTADNRPAGVVTSPAFSPQFGNIALAVVKRPFDVGMTVLQAGGDGNAVRATVVNLPFDQTN